MFVMVFFVSVLYVLAAMLRLGSYLEYHFVEHIPMPSLAHLWFVFLAGDFITSLYDIC